jgi:MFS family permease
MSVSQRWSLLAALYLAQGIPYGFFTQALPVLLREQGLSLKMISATSLLYLPWALKFLWAPLVDRYGTRRQWLLPLQMSAVIGAALLSFIDAASALWLLVLALFMFNLVSATQDIATDGLAVNLLSARERGLGNGIQTGGYRIGMMLGGGLLLWMFAQLGAQAMFIAMTAMLALTVLPVLYLREESTTAPRSQVDPRSVWIGAWARLRQPGMAGFIALICLYKFGDSMGAALVGPFMHDSGIAKQEIALIKGVLGSGSALLGAVAGGWLAWRLGRRTALLSGGLLQTGSLGLYLAYAAGWGGAELLYAACIAEHMLGGIALVALLTLMMDASDPQHASTDYTLLSCALVISQGAALIAASAIADAAGYPVLFAASVLISGGGCLLLVRAVDRGLGPQRLRSIWPQRS